MSTSPTAITLVLVRTVCRFMVLHRAKVTNKRLAFIPHSRKTTTNGQGAGWGRRQDDRNESCPLENVQVRDVFLLINIFDFTRVRADTSDVTILLLIRVIKYVEGGKRRTSSENGTPQPKEPNTRVFHGLFKASVSGKRDPHHIIANLDGNDTIKTETVKDGLHNFIFGFATQFTFKLDVNSFGQTYNGRLKQLD